MTVERNSRAFSAGACSTCFSFFIFLLTVGYCLVCTAQEPPKPADTPAGDSQEASLESRAEQEARSLEKELVRMVKNLLAKSKPKPGSRKPQEKEEATKAAMPEPAQADSEALRNQLAEWKSKSLAMADVLKHEKLADLENRHEQKKKKLAEQIKKRERVVVNPSGKRPGGANGEEAERLERAIKKEMDKLSKEYESERRKIEKESEREKEFIERLAEELRKAVLPDEEKERKRKTQRRKHQKDLRKKGAKPQK